jgi:hypothetical protein
VTAHREPYPTPVRTLWQTVKLLGTKEERAAVVHSFLSLRGEKRPFDVIVTSYESVLKEKHALEKVNDF